MMTLLWKIGGGVDGTLQGTLAEKKMILPQL
jgi:hypothetical protein